MILLQPEALMGFLLVFCRIGSCLSLAPGVSSARVPMQLRLWIAVAASLALTPMLWRSIQDTLIQMNAGRWLILAMSELVVGGLIGLMARCFMLAAQFAGTFASNVIGLAGIPGVPIDETESAGPMATVVSLSAAMTLLASGLHIEVLRSIMESYTVLPMGHLPAPDGLLRLLLDVTADTFLIAMRLAAPFAVYAVIMNISIGFASKFTPQIQVYFVSTGAIMIGGCVLMAWVLPDWLLYFASSYQQWLRGLGND